MSPTKKKQSNPSKESTLLTSQSIHQVYLSLREFHSEAKIELDFENNYQLLVAVILSAQATDISVNLVTKKLFKTIKSPSDLLSLEHHTLEETVRSIGLWKAKAKNLRLMSGQLIDKHQGLVPNTLDKLEALAGVGKKTASVVLNIAFKVPIIAVDTHVYRVSARIGLRPQGLSIDKAAEYLNNHTPDCFMMDAHHVLIFHGRYICKARKPECSKCPVTQHCVYFDSQN